MTTAQTSAAHWVYAHPQAASLNRQLFDAGVEALADRYRVQTSDLYGQGFDPLLSQRDIAGRPGNIVDLMGEVNESGLVPDDVRLEQQKLEAAELLVFQFPLWWYGAPAILKGWFDRVFTNGFAYGGVDAVTGLPLRYGDGGLTGKRALIIVTAGEDPRSIGSRGISGDLDALLFPLTHGTLWYTGIESLDLHVIYDADTLDDDAVKAERDRLTARLAGIHDEVPSQPYRTLRDGEYRGTRALRADILPGRTDLGIHRVAPAAAFQRSVDHVR
ncbi:MULTISPECIES: NAD(P)H-dependent oxidoreductase [unclassified Microbacterium]|uniref:NAD(P)H-dependent oxidoreductase n=1 Tax=unclassified Microbacterium TaxID=2609290 RepID=UPI000EA86B72|nr:MULTISPECIES: NAD(P)H-dependent oxidoreductase [unclassified Microbacterium]MBT2483879.1 NAD(P)H-dependent oxidoreductase [Microbacterium sp. ISL-108]RKN66860.1 flavodoxin family protein [Microbacterium sp. CGR2]